MEECNPESSISDTMLDSAVSISKILHSYFPENMTDSPKELSDQREQHFKTISARILEIQNDLMSGEVRSRRKNERLLELIEISNRVKSIDDFVPSSPLFKCLRLLCVDKEKVIRSQAFRTLRKLLSAEHPVKCMIQAKIDVFIARALDREEKYVWERMQALKLCRQIMEVAPHLMPKQIVMSLISIAQSQEDDFRKVCLDALRDLVVLNPEVVLDCNGLGVFVQAILDPSCEDVASSLMLTLLYLLDQEKTRHFVLLSADLQNLWSIFTDMDVPEKDKEVRKKTSIDALVIMMRSWTGIISFTANPHALKSILQFLRLPDEVSGVNWSRNAIMDFLFDVLEAAKGPSSSRPGSQPLPNLLNNYSVMLLLALIECGIVQVLTDIGIHGSREAAAMATSLLTSILSLCSDLLSPAMNARLNSLPEIVKLASNFSADAELRINSSDMLYELCSLVGTSGTAPSEINDASSKNSLLRGITPVSMVENGFQAKFPDLRKIILSSDANSNFFRYRKFDSDRKRELLQRSMKLVTDAQIDMSELQDLLRSSGVSASKEYQKWNFDICLELLEGPLQSNSHLNFAIQKSKFIKSLLHYLKPSSKMFSIQKWTISSCRCVWTACQVFRVLLTSGFASKLHAFRDLIKEITSAFVFKITGDSGSNEQPPDIFFLSIDSLTYTLSREYFTLIGILSETQEGLELLGGEEFLLHMNSLYRQPKLFYITRLLLANLDFGGHIASERGARTVAYSCILKSDSYLQRYCLNLLRLMLHAGVEDFVDWCFTILSITLSGDDSVISLESISILNEACDDDLSRVSLLLSKNPDFSHLSPSEPLDNLSLKFLEYPDGIKFLSSSGWIEKQLDIWKSRRMFEYVEDVENALVDALNENGTGSRRYHQRTSEEDYDLDRLFLLPWSIEVSILNDDGIPFSLTCDAFGQLRSDEYGHVELFVVGLIQETASALHFNKIEDSCRIHATLSIGGEKDLKKKSACWEVECLPRSRSDISPEVPTISSDGVEWLFSFKRDLNMNPKSKPTMSLKSVTFRVPLSQSSEPSVPLPPHFYGSLAATDDGCLILKRSHHLESFVHAVRDSNSSWTEKRASLWALGHIGKSKTGFSLLSETGIVEDISVLSQTCTTLSMRGTCFYVIGLISCTYEGREFLSQMGWEFPSNHSLAVAVPKETGRCFQINDVPQYERSKHSSYFGVKTVPSTAQKEAPVIDDANAEPLILGYISNLVNNVTRNSSYSVLAKIRTRYGNRFQSMELFHKASWLMETYSFRLPVRRFVWFDLFDQIKTNEASLDLLDSNHSFCL